MSAFRPQDAHSESSDTSSPVSSGSSYQHILDHVLTYPGTYELSLRTMYTLNCTPRAQPAARAPSSASTSPRTPQSPPWEDKQASQSFTESLLAQMSQLPSQPNSLPPSFINSFLRRCFPPDLISVDFPQALTSLDYLKDLETRRRREVAAAMSRLDIDRATLDTHAASLSDRYPGVMRWVQSIEEKERKLEALYTQLYIVLRRWILINEMSLLPFNKQNCIAMLNTLYPPVTSTQPTSRLTPAVLTAQRDAFFKYVLSVEKQGSRILSRLMQQGRADGEETGWPAVTRTLGMYLQVATSMISECSDVSDLEDVSPRKKRESGGSRTTRKADSGVSFTNSDRPLTRTSSHAEPTSPTEMSRPKTPSAGRSGTTLEKLARGLKTIGRSRTDVTEMVQDDTPTPPPPPQAPSTDITTNNTKFKTLRKMRSMGALERTGNKKSTPDTPGFDVDSMRQHRSKYGADVVAARRRGGFETGA